ncbi:RNA polymerase II-associated protein 1 [Malaya genurostris]|uniref:RNA polymerase II-associated protein 1 n=1 Tax=Malaya genurostris TaxID=325434 RepID=UPI0026F3EEEF|nr:RNA polymerase II-associated protein 1 [Malaya genurostris]
MIKRPSKNDSENDILQMQQDFFAETNRDTSFQPAAKVVRVERENDADSNGKDQRQSEFARRRNLKRAQQTEPVRKELVPENTIIGEIVEKHPSVVMEPPEEEEANVSKQAFPKPIPLQGLLKERTGKKSLFAQMFNMKNDQVENRKEVRFGLGTESDDTVDVDAQQIHEENLQKLNQMSEDEILKEKQYLMNTMDPKLLEFLKSRNKNNAPNPKPQTAPAEKIEEKSVETTDLDVLKLEGSDQWINFDILEPEKLEWTKNIQKSLNDLKPGESFEARFDWKGTLQPYTVKEQDAKTDDRELYLHGEDADRPGYTLQELFRLARANVLQQRISALNAIAGILNIYNQGFYDGVLELPISKIFFFLRFALDENTPAVVEAASRALASLFYNDTDETLLDTIYDTKLGIYQPEMGLNVTHSRSEKEEERQKNLESGFNSLSLKSGNPRSKSKHQKVKFEAHLDDDPDDLANRETMNDFHLAETDLLECLLRTNILERIRYILFSMRPEGTTAISCTKLLIRLARTNGTIAVKIATNEQLMEGLIKQYLGSIEAQGKHVPHHLVIKLLRVLCSHGNDFYQQFLNRFHVVSLLKRYVFTRSDINIQLILVQIETFRFMRLQLKCNRDDQLYRDLLPALFYLIEWHYQHLSMDEGGPFIIRQHAASLLALIDCDYLQAAAAAVAAGFTPQNCDRLFACFCKWFNAATKHGLEEFSQKLLLGVCLNVAAKVRPLAVSCYHNFANGYLLPYMKSHKFDSLMQELSNSHLLNPVAVEDRSAKNSPLPNLGGILVNENHPTSAPTLILAKSYPVFLLHAMLDFLRLHAEHNRQLLDLFIHNRHHFSYLSKLSGTVTASSGMSSKSITAAHRSGKATTNWFLKAELNYLLDVLALLAENRSHGKTISDSRCDDDIEMASSPDVGNVRLQLSVAFKVLLYLSEEFYPEIIKLFDQIIFASDSYSSEQIVAEDLQRWKFNYKVKLNSLVTNAVNLSDSHRSFSVVGWRTSLLQPTWPYSLLYYLLEKLEQGKPQLEHFTEEQIIKTSLMFSELVENNFILLATVTEKLMYQMTAFLGPDSKFLDDQISTLITRRIDALRTEMSVAGKKFDFETRLEERKSYHGLYQLVLDVFQSSSYGHASFSALVMVPLAQKYDIQWRNLVWSEHVAVLRFITCSEQQLFGSIDEYRQPTETDITLIKYYSQALNSNLLRPGSIPAQIAAHHVQAYRAKVDRMKHFDDGDK